MGIDNLDSELDWEYMSDFYQEGENKVRSFEEISKETAEDRELQARCAEIDVSTLDDKLAKTVLDVKRVKEESLKGGNVEEIAQNLGMSKEYVTTILMNVQGYAEDDDFAIAHLVLME